jgi:hypothetical protein
MGSCRSILGAVGIRHRSSHRTNFRTKADLARFALFAEGGLCRAHTVWPLLSCERWPCEAGGAKGVVAGWMEWKERSLGFVAGIMQFLEQRTKSRPLACDPRPTQQPNRLSPAFRLRATRRAQSDKPSTSKFRPPLFIAQTAACVRFWTRTLRRIALM